ncbi:uncharacterized protein LOC142353975 [Convolutriloba macropyga]|uniref:uncharacterized protein LOC142353975 n=1 Tax=Convolutriloba macropyga TaxID=536237 RepID=UPI003F51D82C
MHVIYLRSRPTSECQQSIFHKAVDNGYITGYAGSLCNYNELEIEDVVRTCLPPHDHKIAFCDPNVFDPHNPYSFMKGGFSMLKRCLYGRPVHEYMMDYAQSFWNVYPHVPKLFMAYISDAHEWTGELVQYMDEALVKFLRSFQSHLSNTTIFLLSDHGNHLNGIYRLFKPDGPELEMKTPLLNIIRRKRSKRSNLIPKANYFKLVSMYDVHKTVVDFLTGRVNKVNFRDEVLSYNLLNERVPPNRTCEESGITYTAHCICPK